MKAAAACFVYCLSLSAQVQVSLAVVPSQAARRLLNKRAAKICSPWLGTASNVGTERVVVAESAIIAQMIRLQPFDKTAMAILIRDASQNSTLARIARGGQDLTAIGAFIAAGRELVAPWPEVLAGVAWGGPYLVQRVRGVSRPVSENYAALSSGWPLSIEPGSVVSFYVFSAKLPDDAGSIGFRLEKLASVKMAQ